MKFPNVFVVFSIIIGAACVLKADDPQLTPIEQGVIEKLRKGEPVILSENKPGSEKPRLSAGFIERVVTGDLLEKPHRNGIRIIGATINEPLDLTNAQVRCDLWFSQCQFNSDVDFLGASFGGTTAFVDTVFKGKTNFNGAVMKASTLFNQTVFEDEASFGTTTYEMGVSFENAKFTNKTQPATFNHLKAHLVLLKGATFEGPVRFANVEIQNQLNAEEAQFKNANLLDFRRLKVGDAASFNRVRFAGPVSFADAHTVDLIIADMPLEKAPIPEVDLSRALIRRRLLLSALKVKALRAQSLRVEGPAAFSNMNVEGYADLRFAQFATIDFAGSTWPSDSKALQLQGLTFQYAQAGIDESASIKALLQLVSRSAYSADVYFNLEQFVSRLGRRAEANNIFVAGKRRERDENLRGLQWLGSFLLDWLVGYGRHPWQAGIPCMFFVILGCFLFLPSKMEPQKPEYAQRNYNPFWYSLGLFLPFVDLQSSSVWKPKKSRWFLRHYMRVHVLLGWILIPILLAAISGLIK